MCARLVCPITCRWFLGVDSAMPSTLTLTAAPLIYLRCITACIRGHCGPVGTVRARTAVIVSSKQQYKGPSA